MGFVGKRDSKNLKDFVNASLQFHIVLHYRYEAISDYGTIYLDAYSIFGSAPEFLDFEVLLDPFEEQFNTPAIAIKLRNLLG